MKFTCKALENGQTPVLYSKDGQDLSARLTWCDLPAGTRELALLVENIKPQI
jgi:phosphatidylethanolamine-binding protein (PEBP) family uncharacterized protein